MKIPLLISLLLNFALAACAGVLLLRSEAWLRKESEIQDAPGEEPPAYAIPVLQFAVNEQLLPEESDMPTASLPSPPLSSNRPIEDPFSLATDLLTQGWTPADAKAFTLGALYRDFFQRQLTVDSERAFWESPSRDEQRQAANERYRTLFAIEWLHGLHGGGILAADSLPIPLDALAKLAGIEQDYALMRHDFDEGRPMMPEDYDGRATLAEERRRDIAALLTPEQFFEYEMRHSESAEIIRHRTDDIELTEEKFRALVALQMEVDKANPGRSLHPADEELQQARIEAGRKMAEGLRELLAEEELQQYFRNRSWDYQRLIQLTDRLELSREEAGRLHDRYEKAVHDRNLVRWGRLTQEEWQTAGEELGRELRDLLGPEGTELYRRRAGSILVLLGEDS